MSLDVYLQSSPTVCSHCGQTLPAGTTVEPDAVYHSNITHNLGKMADAAGIYEACWRPEEIGATKAGQLIPLLREGFAKLKADPEYYSEFNSPNGWGTYEHFVPWVEQYLAACEKHPEAEVSVSR